MSVWVRHQILEKNSILLILGILLVIAVGGIVEIVPLFYLKSTIEKVDGIRPIRRSSSQDARFMCVRVVICATRR